MLEDKTVFILRDIFSTLAMTSSVSNARVARVKKYNGSTFSILNKTLFRRRNKFRNPDCKITTTLDLVVLCFRSGNLSICMCIIYVNNNC